MRLHPRHYLLLAIVLALAVWNFLRLRRAREGRSGAEAGALVKPVSSAWQAFDAAANLRDAPEAQFTPALNTLRAQTEAAAPDEAADLRGCQMWLMYYRHSASSVGGKPGSWASMATGHVQSCLATHRDVGH